MKFCGINTDTICDLFEDGYIKPYIPLAYSEMKDGKIESGYYWEGKKIPQDKCDAAFWAEVEKKYPTIVVTGEELRKNMNKFERIMKDIKKDEIRRN